MSDQGPLFICFDGSEDSREAIEQTAALMPGRRAIVASGWHSLAGMMFHSSIDDLQGTLREAADEVDAADRETAQQVAEEGAELAAAAGLEAEQCVAGCDHRIWPKLLKLADERDAAILVVGERGLSGVETALLGSVAHGVLHHSERPVLVTSQRSKGSGPGRAMLCYDGSEGSERAIAQAARQLRDRPAEVVSVWQMIAHVTSSALIGAPEDVVLSAGQRLDQESERRAQELADEGAARASEAGFADVRGVAVRGRSNVWAAIVGAAAEREAAVVVTGSRGRSAIRSALLGSVSRGVATHCSAPVLVVPPGR